MTACRTPSTIPRSVAEPRSSTAKASATPAIRSAIVVVVVAEKSRR